MKREILFRGKRIDNGKWIEGAYMYHINRTLCIDEDSVKSEDEEHIILFDGFSDWNMPRGISYVHVDPATVGQYTGLKDKDGTLVFCDDIILKQDGLFNVYGIVRYGDIPAITGNHKHIGFYIEWINDGANLWSEWWRNDIGYWISKCLTAGNIYDNPELLEAQNETGK